MPQFRYFSIPDLTIGLNIDYLIDVRGYSLRPVKFERPEDKTPYKKDRRNKVEINIQWRYPFIDLEKATVESGIVRKQPCRTYYYKVGNEEYVFEKFGMFF